MIGPVKTSTILAYVSIALLVFFMLFSPETSTPFIFISVFSLIFSAVVLRESKYEMEVDGRRLSDLAFGLGVFAVYIILAVGVGSVLRGSAAFTTQSMFKTLAAATIPVLTGNIVATFILFAVLVPVVESVFFFGPVYELVAKGTKTNVSRFNFRNVLVMLFVSLLFTLIHFQARALIPEAARFDDVGLVLTFLFAFLSLGVMVLRSHLTGKHELAPAVYFHIIANATALGIKVGSPVTQAIFGI